MKVAVIQLNATSNKKKNLAKAIRLVKRATRNKAKLICLPEVFNYRGGLDKKVFQREAIESIPGESTKPFLKIARAKKIFILAGSVCERSPIKGKAYNTSVLIDEKGRIIAKYRKQHLFAARIGRRNAREPEFFVAGKTASMARIKGFQAGLSICYDLRFPEIYQQYAKKKCHLIFVPSAFTKKTGEAHWEVLLRSRAIENHVFIIAPNQVGRNASGILSYGNSMIVDPWGTILAKASPKREEIIYAQINKKKIEEIKNIFAKGKREN